MGWMDNGSNRVKVTIDSSKVDSDLTDFTILVYISTSSGIGTADLSFVFDELTADGNRKKIAVTLEDGITECYVEIEKWDDANEKAWLWVKVPSISSTVDTVLYLYFDVLQRDNDSNVGDTNDVIAESVWDANFVLVDHMADGASNAATYDSTSHDNDGTKGGAATPTEVTGQIGDAQNFDGSERIQYGDIDETEGIDTLTVEAIVNVTTWNTNRGIVTKRVGGNSSWALLLGTSDKYSLRITTAGGTNTLSSTGGESTGTNYSVMAVYNGVDMRIYIDGALDSTPFAKTGNILATAVEVMAGRYFDTNNDLDGTIDEIRVSSTDRSAAYAKATHNSNFDTLITYGSEESDRILQVPRGG